ncbi:unnamed protein product [Brachionus calyciflorus]|uniref:BZIP domain-containing protein n=1 Tax=Brachionus calyciflorus TaxID=104777 RepID=A0A813P068_9BILA|nr:unnamed protein product [Brachionus calyciflorus]
MLYKDLNLNSNYSPNKKSSDLEMAQNYSNAELLLSLNNSSFIKNIIMDNQNQQNHESSEANELKGSLSPVLVINESHNSPVSSRALSPISVESSQNECSDVCNSFPESQPNKENHDLLLSSSSAASTFSSSNIENSPINASSNEHDKIEDFNELSPSPSSDCLSSNHSHSYDQSRGYPFTPKKRDGSVCSQTSSGSSNNNKDPLNLLNQRKEVIPQRKRRDFIPAELKDEHYWERRRKNNLAAKRSREKRRLNDLVLETKLLELTNVNHVLKLKLDLCMKKCNLSEDEMTKLFEENRHLLIVQEHLDLDFLSNDDMNSVDNDNSPHIPSSASSMISSLDSIKNKNYKFFTSKDKDAKISSTSSFDDNFDIGDDIESDESEHDLVKESKKEVLLDSEQYPPSKKILLNNDKNDNKLNAASSQQGDLNQFKSHFPLLYNQLCKVNTLTVKPENPSNKANNNEILNKILSSPLNQPLNSNLIGRLSNILSDKNAEYNNQNEPSNNFQRDSQKVNQLMEKYKNLIHKTNMSTNIIAKKNQDTKPNGGKNTINNLLQNIAYNQISSQNENLMNGSASRKRHINQLIDTESKVSEKRSANFVNESKPTTNPNDVNKILQLFLQCAKDKDNNNNNQNNVVNATKFQPLNHLLMLQNLNRQNMMNVLNEEAKVVPTENKQQMDKIIPSYPNQSDVSHNAIQCHQNSGDNMPLKLRFKMLQLKTGEVNS